MNDRHDALVAAAGLVLAVPEEVSGHQGHAAEILVIDRRTLYRKLKQYRGEAPGSEDELETS